MTPVQRIELGDLIGHLDRAHEILIDLEVRLNTLGDHDAAAGFAMDAVERAADFLANLRYEGK